MRWPVILRQVWGSEESGRSTLWRGANRAAMDFGLIATASLLLGFKVGDMGDIQRGAARERYSWVRHSVGDDAVTPPLLFSFHHHPHVPSRRPSFVFKLVLESALRRRLIFSIGRHRVQELNIRLHKDSDATQRHIFSGLSVFTNLSSFTIRNGHITRELHTATINMPSLRRLRLQWCSLFAVSRSLPPVVPFTITDLLLHEVLILDKEGEALDTRKLWILHRLNLSIVPPAHLGRLRALTISSEKSATEVASQAYALLPYTPLLESLNVLGPPLVYRSGPADSLLALNLPLLQLFKGPAQIASAMAKSAVYIAECTVTDEIGTLEALRVVGRLHEQTLRSIELTLTRWDDDVLCEIAHRLSQCKRIKIVHRYSAPGEEFLFNLGPQYLDRMPRLETLLIQARPEDAVEPQNPHHFGDSWDVLKASKKWREDAWLRDVPQAPTVAATREWLAVWKKYTPLLELMDLGGRRWTREFQGSAGIVCKNLELTVLPSIPFYWNFRGAQ
ncbi:hypothetical protein B0H16DRAFT_1894080 [Mycena metata]|uniref:F-box domain-containing protein n=1 Tax=Mycena metata TaxID=1033252 RepID=A0AAD7HU98_9AGAR|nr:hypothetical protein B0H16DRAFT_1894080 [Mycena metata]